MLKSIFLAKSSDSDSKRKTSILIKIIWSVIVIISITFIVNMFMQPEHIMRYVLILLFVWIASTALLLLARNGHTYLSAFLYVSFLLIMIFSFSFTGGGIKGHGIKMLPIVVLFAGLTMGKKEIWLFGIIATIGGLILVMADHFGWIQVQEPLGQSSLIYWIYNTTGIFLLCYLENLSVEELRKALEKSRMYEEKLRVHNDKLIEIAFLQSHMVRRPVASVLGLINLIQFENPGHPTNLQIIPRLEIASRELDDVIRDIVRNTNEVESIANESAELRVA